jgi:serine/threonine protein phosphatase PrpC
VPIAIDACAAQHQADRKEQQDRVAILPHPRKRGVVLALVADGMGGYAGGSLAAEQVLHTAKSSLEHFSPAEEAPEKMLESAMREAHTMIRASRFINEKEPHSTAVMLLLQPGRLTWGHCGDSRLYRFHGKDLVSRTVDHSYVEHLVNIGRISSEEALTHPNRNVLMTSLGGVDEPRIDFAESVDIVAGDSFVLCSDGLWAYFGEVEMGLLLAGNSARRVCEIMIDEARRRARGAGDNVSLAVIKIVDVPAPKPSPSSFRK